MPSPAQPDCPWSRRTFLKSAALLPLANLTSATTGAEDPLIIDSHVHVWKSDPRYPWPAETKTPPDRDATAEQLLALMHASGVRWTVLIQVIYYRWDNRYVASVLKQYPQQFRGVARVTPEDPAAPDHLSRLTEEDGFRGVRISPAANASGDWIRGALMDPLWRRCRDTGIPMTVLAPVSRMPDIMRLADRFPDLTVVIDHMADSPLAHPRELEALLALRRFPRLHVKISHSWSLSAQVYPYLDSQEQIRRLYDAFGPRRLMAGTDWPLVEKYCTYADAINLAQSRIGFLSSEDRRWVCGMTAAQVWGFGA
jgi:L-fuconolactonase